MAVVDLIPTTAIIVDRTPVPVEYEFGRIIHEWERSESYFRTAVPEVYLLLLLEAFKRVELTPELQRFWYDLFRFGAPSLPDSLAPDRWTSLLWTHRAFTNGTGFNDPEYPRYNAITGENKYSPNPELDKDRICGGATVRILSKEVIRWYNVVTNNYEVSEVSWIETLNPNSMPSFEELIASPWLWFHATICYKAKTGMFPFGVQADLGIWEPSLVPLIANAPVCYPSKYIQPFQSIADPYIMYLPLQSPTLIQQIRRLVPNFMERVQYTFMN